VLTVGLIAALSSTALVVWAWYAWLPHDDELPSRYETKWMEEVRLIRFVIRAYPTLAGLCLLVQLICAVGFMTYLPIEGEWFRPDRRWLWLFASCMTLLPSLFAGLSKASLDGIRREIASRPPPLE
jgi:hypothetical protein